MYYFWKQIHGLQSHQSLNPQKLLGLAISTHHGRGDAFAGRAKESNLTTEGAVSITSELDLIIRVVEL